MKSTLSCLAMVLLLAGSVWARSKNDWMVGYWRSSTGADITVSYNDNNTFGIDVWSGGRPVGRGLGYWLSATNWEFSYRWQGDVIYGTYVPGSDYVIVRNQSGTWHANWDRRR